MTENYTEQSLGVKIMDTKLQLATSLDKATKLTEFADRVKYVDIITNLKRELEQLKLKLDKDHNLELCGKSYNKVVLKINALVGDLNLKQSKHLWNKENRRKNKQEYEDLMQQLMERQEKINILTNKLSIVEKQNIHLKQEYSTLQSNLKIILNSHHQSSIVSAQTEAQIHFLKQRVLELQKQSEKNLSIVIQLKQLQRQNLLVCEKGAEQIHSLSRQLASSRHALAQLRGNLLQKQCLIQSLSEKILNLQKNKNCCQDQITQSKTTIQDQQFRLRTSMQQLETLKQILSKRNEQFKDVREHYQGRMLQIKSCYQKNIKDIQKQRSQDQERLKELTTFYNSESQQLTSTIKDLKNQIDSTNQQLKQKDLSLKNLSLKYQTQCLKLNQQIFKMKQLYKEKEATYNQLITERQLLHTQNQFLSDQKKNIQRNQCEEIQILSRRVLKYHTEKQKILEEASKLTQQNDAIRRMNQQLLGENRILQVNIIELKNEITKRRGQYIAVQTQLTKERKFNNELRQRNNELVKQLSTSFEQKIIDSSQDVINEKRQHIQNKKYNNLLLQYQEVMRKLQQSNKQIEDMRADNTIQYQQQIKHSQQIKVLRKDIQSLICLKAQNQEYIRYLQEKFNQMNIKNTTKSQISKSPIYLKSLANTHQGQKSSRKIVDNEVSQSRGRMFSQKQNKNSNQNSRVSSVHKSKHVKIRVLEDIRKIINTMSQSRNDISL